MSPLSSSQPIVRFGHFVLDLRSGELRRNGIPVKLQVQPFQVLQTLLEQAGQIVTREDLQKRIWPADTFVDFDQGLNTAVKKLREALGDDAEKPRFIQTLTKRGYRFIGSIHNGLPATKGTTDSELPAKDLPKTYPKVWGLSLGAMVTVLILVLGFNTAGIRDRVLRKSSAQRIESLAVLPLQNLSGDPNQEYFSDGITDALITDLAQIGSVKVISRTSIMRYKKTDKSLPEIASELNVDAIIEGSVQRSGNRVHITAQLIQASSDKHLWANTYERDLRDLFAVEREVTRDIADQVQARITTKRLAPDAQIRPVNLEALDLYLQGNYHLNKADLGPNDEELRKAGVFFQQSIDVDPVFAPAYIGLAEAHHTLWWPSSEDFGIFKNAAARALELAPNSSEARTEAGLTKWEEWNWSSAEEEFRKAITLNPNNAFAHDQLGAQLDAMGRLEEGWTEQELAQELDPNSDYLSWALYRRGEYDHAVQLIRTTLQSHPDYFVLHWLLSQTYAQEAMDREWIQELSKSLTLLGYAESADQLQGAFATSGQFGATRLWARKLEQLSTKQGYFPGMLAQVYARLGDKDRAFYWLNEGVDHHFKAISDPVLEWTKIDPGLAPLRSDPRFSDVIRRMGLPP